MAPHGAAAARIEQIVARHLLDIGAKDGAKPGAPGQREAVIGAEAEIAPALADQPGSVRLGKQVVSWGESTFIQNGINSVNPVDVSAFRRPGAEVKEGLIPVNMFFVQQSLTESLSAEAFYQLEWDQTVVDNCGTFFAQPDVVADGCTDNLRLLTNNPTKRAGLEGYGLEIVGRVPLAITPNQYNMRYLRSKRDRMGHDLPGLPWHDDDVSWASLATRRRTRDEGEPPDPQQLYGLTPGLDE